MFEPLAPVTHGYIIRLCSAASVFSLTCGADQCFGDWVEIYVTSTENQSITYVIWVGYNPTHCAANSLCPCKIALGFICRRLSCVPPWSNRKHERHGTYPNMSSSQDPFGYALGQSAQTSQIQSIKCNPFH